MGWVVCNENGWVIMYVDKMIDLMCNFIGEIECCCKI